MKVKLFAAVFAAGCVVLSSPCYAWSENGHQTVGAIADILLQGTNAEAQVHSILGTAGGQQLSLQSIAVWADCVRGVHPDQGFIYDPGKYKVQACQIFEDDAGKQAMIDYARRNNSNCPYSGKNSECHKSFHFADVDIEHDSYSTKYVGTHDYDIVHAIDAAIFVLQGQPSHAPFNIASKKEALMLLTHFVGDLHQPLHVGAIYLDQDGSVVDPDAGTFDPATDTIGGNAISGTGGNLHSQWDHTKFALSDPDAMNALATQARRVGTTDGDYLHWAEIWAGDTVVVAQESFQNISFSAKGDGKTWPATYDDRRAYVHDMQTIQKQQVIKGGARLAKLLTTIWPNTGTSSTAGPPAPPAVSEFQPES